MRGSFNALIGLALLASLIRCSAHTSLAYVWTDSPQLLGGSGSRVEYQSVAGSSLSEALLKGNLEDHIGVEGKSASSEDLVTVLVYGQQTRSSLSQDTSESLGLAKALKSAAATLYLPSILEHSEIEASAAAIQIGSCQSGGQEASLNDLKAQLNGQSLTVKVCEGSASGSNLKAVQELVSATNQPSLMAYFSQPDEVVEQHVGRSLLQTSATKLCSAKCQTQVMLFECIILLVILLWALWIGMNMLHILDTPSRFETEKKDQNRHQD